MTKGQIVNLVNQNEAIADAWKQFKKDITGWQEIIDMSSQMHMNMPFDEVFIKYKNCAGAIKTYHYLNDYSAEY